MRERKENSKISLAQVTQIYLIVAALIMAAMIMGAYCHIYSKTAINECFDRIDSFEDTYKFMKDKEAESAADVEEDLSVSDKLVASAKKMSGDELKTDSIEVSGSDVSEEKKVIEEGVDYQGALDDLAAAYGCVFLSLDADGSGDYSINAATNGYASYEKLSALGLVSLVDGIKEKGVSTARINGKPYVVICTKVFDTKLEPDDAAVILIPLQGFISRSFMLTAALLFAAIAMCIALAVWLLSIYRRLKGGSLADAQESSFSYRRIRSKVVIAVAAATIIAYICSVFSMSIDGVYMRTSRGTATLEALFDRLDGDAERTEVQWESSQERYKENAKTLAALIDDNRSLQNEAWLREASDIIDADYIMIFDADGNELISDSEYRGISLRNYSDADMSDFNRLLNGVESISHAGVHDEITGLTRDYHGTCLKYLAGKDGYGAMLIAVDPDRHSWIKFRDVNNVMDSMAPNNGFIMEVDPATGVIAHSSNRTLIGTALSEKETDDLFLGYLKFKDETYYAVSASHGGRLYYYCIDKSYMYADVQPFALGYTLLFLIMTVMLSVFLLKNHPEREGTGSTAVISEKATDRISAFIQKAADINGKLLSLRDETETNRRLLKAGDWDDTPEHEALSILELLVFLFTMCVGIVLLVRSNTSSGNGTVLDFIIAGKWTHGPNLFSFAAIYFLFCALFVILAVLKMIYAVLSTMLGKRALTISSLLLNIVLYAAIFTFVFISLSFLGVDTKALIASAGFFGLAVSLSLQDILSDIFAGLMLITGRMYEVGDYIEIKDAGSGTVKMIGLRRTELIADNGKTFSIRNSHISKVINLSRDGMDPGKDADKEDKTNKKSTKGKN